MSLASAPSPLSPSMSLAWLSPGHPSGRAAVTSVWLGLGVAGCVMSPVGAGPLIQGWL